MPLAAIQSDRHFFHIDIYEQRGSAYVKIGTKGPFETTDDKANEVFDDTVRENPTATINAYVFDPSIKRWRKWR